MAMIRCQPRGEALRYCNCRLDPQLRTQLCAEGLRLNTLGMAWLDAGRLTLAKEQFLRERVSFSL